MEELINLLLTKNLDPLDVYSLLVLRMKVRENNNPEFYKKDLEYVNRLLGELDG